MPKRIQRSRRKGWRAPDGAVYVGRGSKWGNSYKVRKVRGAKGALYVVNEDGFTVGPFSEDKQQAIASAVQWFELDVRTSPEAVRMIREELAGRDLMCWCPLDQPCHADVLLEIANGEEQ